MPQTIHIFPCTFLMLGPFKIPGPSAKITSGADKKLARQMSLRVIVFSCIALGLLIVYNALNKLIIVHQ